MFTIFLTFIFIIVLIIDDRSVRKDYFCLMEQRNNYIIKFQLLNTLYFYEKDIINMLRSRKINDVAIYGLSDIGNHIYRMLSNNNLNVIYGVDVAGGRIYDKNIPVFNTSEILPEVDLIIISLDKNKYPDVREKLKFTNKEKVIYLQDILYNVSV